MWKVVNRNRREGKEGGGKQKKQERERERERAEERRRNMFRVLWGEKTGIDQTLTFLFVFFSSLLSPSLP